MVLPPNKRQKAPKNSSDSMSKLFFNPSECNKSCTHLHLQGRQKGLFNSGVLEKRELFGERRAEWSVYYKFCEIYSNTEFLSTRRALATLSTVKKDCVSSPF